MYYVAVNSGSNPTPSGVCLSGELKTHSNHIHLILLSMPPFKSYPPNIQGNIMVAAKINKNNLY